MNGRIRSERMDAEEGTGPGAGSKNGREYVRRRHRTHGF